MFVMCRDFVHAGGGEGAANGEPAGGRQGSWFVRNTAPDAVAVGDRSFAVDGILDDRACQVYEQPDPITLRSLAQLCTILNELCELVVVCRPIYHAVWEMYFAKND